MLTDYRLDQDDILTQLLIITLDIFDTFAADRALIEKQVLKHCYLIIGTIYELRINKKLTTQKAYSTAAQLTKIKINLHSTGVYYSGVHSEICSRR